VKGAQRSPSPIEDDELLGKNSLLPLVKTSGRNKYFRSELHGRGWRSGSAVDTTFVLTGLAVTAAFLLGIIVGFFIAEFVRRR
jgi:hypothetical protein